MKGFIEVHATDGEAVLINVNAIEAVEDRAISAIGSEGCWYVKETYEQIVCKIRMAVEE